MDFSKMTNEEIAAILRKHDKKVREQNFASQEDLDEAWGATYEWIMRSQAKMAAQEARLSQLEEDLGELIVTDITYRGAYKFIYEKGMEREFESFLNKGIDEVVSNVIAFPKPH